MKNLKIISKIIFILLIVFVCAGYISNHKVLEYMPMREEIAVKEEILNINFVGDIMLGRTVNTRIRAQTDVTFPFQNVKDIFAGDDYTFANLESPFGEVGRHNSPGLVFNADAKDASRLHVAGINFVSLANNHALDQGIDGINFTKKTLKENSIAYTGVGAECHQGEIITVKNIKIGVLAYSYTGYNSGGHAPSQYVCDWEDFEAVTVDVKDIQNKADIIIVLVHAGTENSKDPEDKDKKRFRSLIDSGADLVIGAHPHVLQPIEEYNGGLIAYSLGNFVFDQIQPDQKISQILNVTLDKSGYKSHKVTPIKIENLCCPDIVAN